MRSTTVLMFTLSWSLCQADQLITPTSLTTNGVSEFFPAINLINDSGFSEPVNALNYQSVTHSAANNTVAWTTDNPNGAGDYFTSGAEGILPVFTFTLPASSTVNGLVYWGYHFNAANGNETREFLVEFSNDGGTTFPESTMVSSELSTFAVGNSITLPFEEDFTADTIRVSLTDNHFGGTAAGGDRMGLGEIKFVEIILPPLTAVPVEIASDGSIQSDTFGLTNPSDSQTYTVTAITLEGLDAGLFTVDSTFPIDIAPGQTVDIDYTITPGGGIPSLDAKFIVTTTPAGDSPVEVPVSGFVRDPWLVSTDANFAPIAPEATESATITFTNDGATRDLILNGSAITFDPSGAFSVPDLGVSNLTIPPKQSADLEITFDSTGLSPGTYNSIVNFTSNDLSVPDLQLAFTAVVSKTPLPADLVGWWSFDGNGNDNSSFAHPITEVGVIDYSATGANANTGTAAVFDGTTSITIPATGILNPDSFTVTMWARPDDINGYQSLITSRTDHAALDGRTYGYILYLDNASDWAFWSGDGDPGPGTWNAAKSAANDPIAGEWVHLALTYDRSTGIKTLYLNGTVLATQENILIERNLLTDIHLGSGSDTGTLYYYRGQLDDLAIFCEPLDEAQINSIMNDGVAGYIGADTPLAITGFEISDGRFRITEVSGLRTGQTYHLEAGSSLEDFTPVFGSSFDKDSPTYPSLPATDSKLFVRVVEGQEPPS